MTARDKPLALRAQNEHGSRTVKTAKSSEDPLLTVLTVANPSAFLKEGSGPGNTTPSRSEPHFPEGHCSECGKVGGADDPLIGAGDGYLRHRACISLWRERAKAEDAYGAAKTAKSPAPVITCWHCDKATYRPRRLAWGKDLIPLHDRCIGPWIDAWDAMLAARSSLEEVRSDPSAPDADHPEGSEEGGTDASPAEKQKEQKKWQMTRRPRVAPDHPPPASRQIHR